MAEYDLKLIVDADTTEAQRKLDELAAAQSSPEVQAAAERVRDYVTPYPDRAQPAPRPQPQPPAQPPSQPAPRPQPQPPAQPPSQPAPRPQPQPPAQPPSQPAPRPQPQPPAHPPVPQSTALPSVVPQTTTPQVHTPAAQDAADHVRKFRLDPNYKPNLSNNPDDFGNKAGEIAGKAIGKAVAGFVAHEVSTTIFNGLKTPGGDNRTVNQAEAGVGGALKYGTVGAILGGPLGAILGGIGGAVMGVFQENQRQQKAVEARDVAIKDADYRRRVNTEVGMTDSAFGKSLELAGGWRQRQEMIRARRDEIANGKGDWSIKSLERQLKDADPESSRGKSILANLEMQKNRVAQLDSQLVDEGLAVAPSRMDPGSVADSWAKRGVMVGAQVDVAQVNEKIMGEVQSCRALLEKIANMGTDRLATVESIKGAVYG